MRSRSKKTLWVKTNYKTIILVLAVVFCFTSLFSPNVFAEESSSDIVETTFFGNLKDDGKGCGVYTILNAAVDIMTTGIGILGVIGIMVVGIQYLTGGNNETQTQKAKRRITEIVIGLVAFAILYALLQWLLPGGKLNNGTKCETVSDETLAQIRDAEQKARQEAARAAAEANTSHSNNKDTSSNPSQKAPSSNPVDSSAPWSERIAQTAELLAWPKGKKYKKYYHHNYAFDNNNFKKWSDLGTAKPNAAFMKAIDTVWPKHSFKSVVGLGADCGTFVNVVLAYSGHDPGKAKKKAFRNYYASYFPKRKTWKEVKKGKIQRGDVCFTRDGMKFHTRIYLGNSKIAEAGHFGKNFGHITGGGCGRSTYRVFRAVD